jgi:hypothetical protein
MAVINCQSTVINSKYCKFKITSSDTDDRDPRFRKDDMERWMTGKRKRCLEVQVRDSCPRTTLRTAKK